jgi:hypothetical protein
MLAGAVFLFQLTTRDDLAAPVPVGESIAVADMIITVERSVEADGELDVSVSIGGVDDPDGAAGFRLIASGRPLRAASTPGSCGGTSVAARTCVVRFDVSGIDGTSRVLFYERGDEQARWVLA